MEQTLVLLFKNEMGRTVRFSVRDPIDPIDPAVVDQAMDILVDNNIFAQHLVEKAGAELIENTVTKIELP